MRRPQDNLCWHFCRPKRPRGLSLEGFGREELAGCNQNIRWPSTTPCWRPVFPERPGSLSLERLGDGDLARCDGKVNHWVKFGTRQQRHSLLEADAAGWYYTSGRCSLMLHGVVTLTVIPAVGLCAMQCVFALRVHGQCKGEGGFAKPKPSHGLHSSSDQARLEKGRAFSTSLGGIELSG